MKKQLLILSFMFAFAGTSISQTSEGSYIENFTFKDINGKVYNLYDYTNAGKMVVIDVSATWCDPCWQYHKTHALNDFYKKHGPSGTDKAMVFFIEGDTTTTDSDLKSAGKNSQGDWVTGQEMPIVNVSLNSTLANAGLSVDGYPTLFVICPNRLVYKVGHPLAMGSLTQLESYLGKCPEPVAENDAKLLKLNVVDKTCDNADLIVQMYNNGSKPITTANITASLGNTVVANYNWTGNLNKYDAVTLKIGEYLPVSSNEAIKYTITTPDSDLSNNLLTKPLSRATIAARNTVMVKVVLDQYGTDIVWGIFKGNGSLAYKSKKYIDYDSPGEYPQPDTNIFLPDDCYKFLVIDYMSDGLTGDYGNGYIQVIVDGKPIASITNFTGSMAEDMFQLEAVADINELGITPFIVYPNPTSENLNIEFEATNSTYTIDLVDIQGRKVLTKEYSGLEGVQNIVLPVADLSKGSYLVNVTSYGITKSQHVIIQ
jgi:thiol-disulfide isomerase/thioredoxin